MAKITGIEGMTPDQLRAEIARGGRFVYFTYALSFLVITLRRSSDIMLIRAGESAVTKGLPYTLLSFFLGWWGIPWGFIYTPQALWKNLHGGTDVTAAALQTLGVSPEPYYGIEVQRS